MLKLSHHEPKVVLLAFFVSHRVDESLILRKRIDVSQFHKRSISPEAEDREAVCNLRIWKSGSSKEKYKFDIKDFCRLIGDAITSKCAGLVEQCSRGRVGA